MMRDWQAFLTDEEREIYNKAGYAKTADWGKKPALLTIDCTLAFTGSSPDQNLQQAMEEFPTACGPAAWESLPHIRSLLEASREQALPIIFTNNDLPAQGAIKGATKGAMMRKSLSRNDQLLGNTFPEIIQPLAEEWVMPKARASAFFGTPLHSFLIMNGVDSVIVCGTSTSGCVRASAVDAFSHGFKVFVVEECCFDRVRTSHLGSLWDLNAKYATVVTLEETLQYIRTLR